MNNQNLKILVIALLILAFSAYSQDSLAVKTKCDSLKAIFEEKMKEWKKVEISMKSNDLTKTRYDELLPVYDGLWKESCELQKKWLICKADNSKTISFEPPPPPPPPQIIEEEIFDINGPSTKPELSEEYRTQLKNYIKNNYPAQALKDSISGAVIIKFICTKEGVAEKISVTLEKPPNLGFGEVAVEAIKKVKFTPSLNSRGKAVITRMSQKLIFEPPKKQK
ncbi:TPA: hypothetical protein DCR49_05375 [Candidatus Delongbacteria bacterium]|nr:hypothetical protein [Candidatus Delongbacteria bacterium]